ncbi:MAG: NUDIX hydrolase [Lachnospiraceae bacterium]|nr:NUDIX hydrolase [Lachnospiraceae bacterium]
MKFKKIEKVHQGRFITRYDVTYETEGGHEKVYEMISRDPNMNTEEALRRDKIDAVVLVIFDESGERILLDCEYRLAVDAWVYNFPAGLIDPGETPEEAARRELREETGLELYAIEDVIGESYSAVGFSNEKNLTIVGRARGTFAESDSEYEEIRSAWYTKEEVRELLKSEVFAGRTQAYCYVWSRS